MCVPGDLVKRCTSLGVPGSQPEILHCPRRSPPGGGVDAADLQCAQCLILNWSSLKGVSVSRLSLFLLNMWHIRAHYKNDV